MDRLENADDGRVGIEAANRRDRSVVAQVAVDFVGDDREPVFVRHIEERAARVGRIRRAGRIVRIDDDERARRRRHEAAQVVEIGHPATIGIGAIEDGARAELGDDGRVERIRRHRHEHIAAFVDERRQRELDTFGRAGGEEGAIGRQRESPATCIRPRRPRGPTRFPADGP